MGDGDVVAARPSRSAMSERWQASGSASTQSSAAAPAGGELCDERVEVGAVEDLVHVALGVLRRSSTAARALADAGTVVGGVLQVAQLGRRRQVAVVAIRDAGLRGARPVGACALAQA